MTETRSRMCPLTRTAGRAPAAGRADASARRASRRALAELWGAVLAGGLDEPDAHRLTNRVDAVVDVQLPVDVADVGVHRALGDDQLAGDLAAGEALGEQREDLPLTTGEQVVDVG